MSSAVKTLDKPRLSVKAQTLWAVGAVVGAVALPQLFHLMGAVSGLGTKLGEAFLPMHLPIILAGLLAGPYAGAIAGFLSPLISFALSGMPSAAMLPFMMIELCAYGLASGLLRNVKLPVIGKVLIAQAGGRAVRAAAIAFSVYALGNDSIKISVIWTSIASGIFGLALQWVLIPLIVFRAENGSRK
ncbi:ECF transporter S component [Huintestinicola sp.]|uniref:ECF transporter S component n=1 Tax=Huintestinicola sp. TaxID=2981661 RepID=UPI003D7E2414